MIQKISDKNKSGIYIIENKISNKFYIGKSKNIYNRIKDHITSLNTKNKNENIHMINAWHKYGRGSFYYYVLEYCELNDDTLSKLEYYWIITLNAINKGYNMRLDTTTKCILTEETKLKMSNSKLEYYRNPENRKKCSHSFWKNNPEATLSMAESVSKKVTKFSIEQYTKDNTLINTWNSVKDVINKNPDYKWQNIYSVCNGYKPSYMGYIWKKVLKK